MLGVFLLGLLLAATLYIAIRIPAVQTRAVQEASEILSRKLRHKVSIQRVDISFFNQVLLDKVKVLDYKKEVLFSVAQIQANISVFNIFKPNKLYLSNVTLSAPEANLVKYAGSDSLNMSSFIRAVNKLLSKKDTIQTKTAFDFKIDAVTIKNGRFTYDDQNKPHTKFGVDYQHMAVDSINGYFSNIQLGDTVRVRVQDLSAVEIPSKTRVLQLNARMAYATTFWEFNDLLLKLGDSQLAEYLRFDYKRFGNFRQFNDSVLVTANLQNAVIYSDDVAQFVPKFKDINDQIKITGEVKGRLKRFYAKNTDIRYGKNTRIVGNVSASGLPAIRETFLELDLKPSVLDADDIQKYIPKKTFIIADRLGTVKLNGNFVGFYNDFVANGSFNTALGKVESDVNMKLNQKTNLTYYSGYVKTNGFNLGAFINNSKIISTVSVDGRIKGHGFDLESADLEVDAKINAVRLYGYNYQNIVTDATLQNQVFSGNFKIQDPNVQLTAQGDVNLNPENPSFDLKTDIDHVNLKALGFTNQNIQVKTTAVLDFSGLKPDAIVGSGHFRNTTLTLNQNTMQLDSVLFISDLANGQRSLQVLSDLADIKANGTWQYTTLKRDINVLLHEYKLNFESNDAGTDAYYARKKRVNTPDYEFNYTIRLKKFNSVIQAFVPALSISQNTPIEGSFRQGANAIFTLTGQIDTLRYGKNTFLANAFELNTSKLPYSEDVLANAIVTSARQTLQGVGATENLFLEGVWNDRSIQFASNLAQPNTTNQINLTGNLAFLADKLQIVFNTSNIRVLEKEWAITPSNTIEIFGAGKEINFIGFDISHGIERISLKGILSQNPANELNAQIANFRLENLNPVLKQKLRGILNATLSARDIYNQAIITSELTADSVYMDNYLVGNVTGTTDWDNTQKRLGVNLGLNRQNMRVLNVTGYFNPGDPENALDLLAVMDEAPIKLIEPLLSTLFNDLSGTMAGRINITGQLSGPSLAGSAFISNGRFNFKYLNTVYTFSDRITFTENDITFQNIKLRDILNNTGTLSGSIIHQGFKDMILDLRGEFQKFMVLNTTRENNPIYYGTAIATGSATVLGSPTNLFINIDARSEAGTRMFIPLDNHTTVTRQNFIRFVDRSAPDSTVTMATNNVDLSGINMNFNLNITPDAYLEIILNQTTGDIVRGSGNGRINMTIDTRGEFTMDGQVEIVRGAYNFTLYNIINKEFTIRPGGTITWNGDPYEGIMDITANYTQTVPLPGSLVELQNTLSGGQSTSTPMVPVTAVMNLKGNLLTPQILLDLEFRNAPSDLETVLAPFLADLRNNQDELNRQVFSLLILKRLSERNEIGTAGPSQTALQGGVGTISELVTNQLGNLLSQLDTNLEVDIGLNSLDEVALRNLQVRLSYSLMEGRLRVTREGALSNGQLLDENGIPVDNRNSIAGDWRIEYYLGRNGKVRARLEYVTSQRRFGTSNTSTTRVSLLHTEQFDTFAELFARRRLRRRDVSQNKDVIILDDDVRYDEIK